MRFNTVERNVRVSDETSVMTRFVILSNRVDAGRLADDAKRAAEERRGLIKPRRHSVTAPHLTHSVGDALLAAWQEANGTTNGYFEFVGA